MGGSILTLAEICDAIESKLGAATGITRSQSYDELTEGAQDAPLLQVWPRSCSPVSLGSETHKLTLGKGTGADRDITIEEEVTIFADVYRPRRHLDEDMGALVDCADAIRTVLKAQDCPPFDLTGVRTFQWSFDIGSFEYAGITELRARFTLVLRIF